MTSEKHQSLAEQRMLDYQKRVALLSPPSGPSDELLIELYSMLIRHNRRLANGSFEPPRISGL